MSNLYPKNHVWDKTNKNGLEKSQIKNKKFLSTSKVRKSDFDDTEMCLTCKVSLLRHPCWEIRTFLEHAILTQSWPTKPKDPIHKS